VGVSRSVSATKYRVRNFHGRLHEATFPFVRRIVNLKRGLASFKKDVSHQRVGLRTAQPFFVDLRAGAYRVFMSLAARGKLRISFRPCG